MNSKPLIKPDITYSSIGTQQSELPALQIPAIDISNNGGLGNNDLSDPAKGVPMFYTLTQNSQPHDYVRLFWGGIEVAGYPLTQEHIDAGRAGFSVLPIYLPDSPPLADVYYVQTFGLAGNPVESAHRSVLVKRSVPGTPDPDPSTPTVNEYLLPPSGVPPIIDTAVDITLSVPNWTAMAENDVLTVYWGGTAVRRPPLPADQIGLRQNVVVPAATLIAEGDRDQLVVRYEIRDTVNNWSLFSLPAYSDVSVNPNAPQAPRVDDADAQLVIDLALLGQKDVSVTIPTGLAVGDLVTLNWLGKTLEGAEVNPVIAPKPVVSVGFAIVFGVPNADVQAIASGTAVVRYSVKPAAGGADLRSRSVMVSVQGQPVQLTAPLLEGTVGDNVDPAALPDPTVVRIAPYPGKNFGDRVVLDWDGRTLTGALPYSDYYDVGRNEETQDITFAVPKTYLNPLANGTLTLTYTVQYYSSSPVTSASTVYQVAGADLLPAPTVDHAPGDVLDPDLTTSTRVHVNQAALKRGDNVTIYWTGSPGAGTDSHEYLVNSDGQQLQWNVVNPLIEANRNGTVNVRYEVVRAAGRLQNSAVLPLQIRPAAVATYPAPTVREAPTGVLDPMTALAGATLTVAYDDMELTDVIVPSWDHQNALIPWQQGNASKSVDFVYPPSVVAASLNQAFDVSYGVARGATQPASDILRLTVSAIPANELAKSKPLVTEATGAVLDLQTFFGNAHVHVPQWPLAVVGQRVWLTVSGPGGVPLLKVLNGYPITQQEASNGIARDIPRPELEKFVDGSQMTVECKVTFDGSNTEASAVAFPTVAYTVKQAVSIVPSITSVRDSNGPVGNGGTTYDTRVDLVGKASPSQSIAIFDGLALNGNASVDVNGDWATAVTALVLGSHVLTAKNMGSGLTSPPWAFDVISQQPPLNLVEPSVLEATGEHNDVLDYALINDNVHVVVPDYNMQIGDTVKVYWLGNVETGSEIKPVTTIAPLTFVISKYEVIDVIGRSANVWYTVKRPPSPTEYISAIKRVVVLPQEFELPAPTINANRTIVTVQRGNLHTNFTVEVRWIGVREHETPHQTLKNENHLDFSIPTSWVDENRGKRVLINYSVRLANDDGRYRFSRILRLDI